MFKQSNNEVVRYYRTARQDETAIFNQKLLLDSYCEKHGLTTTEIYVDDGFSGLNFNRPGWKKLLADTANGPVKTVITTSIDRIGRDYYTTGKVIEELYQNDGVDFIFVRDGINSAEYVNTFLPLHDTLAALVAKQEGGDVQ
ncbi:recombinase family protein [Listeria kieliensis]|uniref:Resolvase/invertase-type recombinase catalytic domain-containing protein n=1 Tax=Listeria kieliensis TaxID=1621700 RepID=A0A3D8TSW5_9LIST|nr:recombinase family protein [Listeria kieliensis]RDX00876.1 hypothetical protein UR08_07875 [Listeria kieliensis]